MKRLLMTALAVCFMAAAVAVLPVREAKNVSAETGQVYHLVDKFGAAPNARSFSEGMETTKLNSVLSEYSAYGIGAHLKSTSTGREYIEYDVDGVVEAEVTGIFAESNFGSFLHWDPIDGKPNTGVSMGVTTNPAYYPINNINNINLDMVYPIYLSKDGKPFIKYDTEWWGYIADPKYSFIPASSKSDPAQQLRAFTVPEEVLGVVDEETNEIVKPGYLYPMINLEYCVEGSEEWIPMSLDKKNYSLTDAEYIEGGDKEYEVTVKIKNIPEDAVKIRIGADYIRQTLKPSSTGDIDPDVYIPYPRRFDESLFVTKVNLTLDTEYNGGFEELAETGISVDASNATRYFAFGEEFNSENVVFYNEYEGGIKEKAVDTSAFTIDASEFDPYKAGTYAIKVKRGDFVTQYNVRVEKPSELIVDTTALDLELGKGEKFSAEGLIVKAKTTLPGGATKEIVLPETAYTVDTSKLNVKKGGTYAVSVSVGEGENAVSTSFDVKVTGDNTVIIIVSVVAGVVVVAGAATGIVLFMKKKKKA